MTDDRFTSEYRKAVNKIELPVDFREKIISGLNEQSKEQQPSKTILKPKFTAYRTIASVVAAVLVVAVGLTLMLTVVPKLSGTQDICFSVASATDLQRISGARVVFRTSSGKILTDRDGSVVEAHTDENGVVTTTVPTTESLTAEVTADGFIPFTTDVSEGNVYISPVMDENTYRAVLTWEQECDLDAHLSVTGDNVNHKLFYFRSDITDSSGEVIAALDTDSADGSGPETITFNTRDDSVYRYTVASYSSLKDDTPINFSETGVCLTLYKGDKLIGEYRPEGENTSVGNAWCVLEIQNHSITFCDEAYPINAIADIK